MALDALELIIIALLVVVIFMWGPTKIPQMARALGLAKKEFQDASKGEPGAQPVSQPPSPTGDLLIDTARRLGISTEGKSREQISEEIVRKAQK
jgi:sec-independent protein translocase protein TatA